MKKIKDAIWLIFNGFLIGTSMIIPGVSGGTMAMIMGVYERLIDTLSNLRKHLKQSLWVILWIAVGGATAFLGLSHTITYCLDHFLFPTILLFVGAVIGGIPMLWAKVKGKKPTAVDLVAAAIAFIVVIALAFLQSGTDMDLANITILKAIKLFFGGAIASAAMVVPGVSGSALLMTFGMYEPIMLQVKSLTTAGADKGHAVAILMIVGVGILAGLFGIAKAIEYLLKHHEQATYWGIIGFVVSSGIVILMQNFFFNGGPAVTLAGTPVYQYIIGILLGLAALFATYFVSKKEWDL